MKKTIVGSLLALGAEPKKLLRIKHIFATGDN